jgi:hypothetical protein
MVKYPYCNRSIKYVGKLNGNTVTCRPVEERQKGKTNVYSHTVLLHPHAHVDQNNYEQHKTARRL